MYKKAMLIVVLVSGVYASENPFAVDDNLQKIELDEDALLQLISKEKKVSNSQKDKKVPVKSIAPVKKIYDVKTNKVPPPKKEKSRIVKVQKEKIKPKKINIVEKKAPTPPSSDIKKVTKISKLPKKKTADLKTKESISKQIEKVDAKIKELEDKLSKINGNTSTAKITKQRVKKPVDNTKVVKKTKVVAKDQTKVVKKAKVVPKDPVKVVEKTKVATKDPLVAKSQKKPAQKAVTGLPKKDIENNTSKYDKELQKAIAGVDKDRSTTRADKKIVKKSQKIIIGLPKKDTDKGNSKYDKELQDAIDGV